MRALGIDRAKIENNVAGCIVIGLTPCWGYLNVDAILFQIGVWGGECSERGGTAGKGILGNYLTSKI